MAYNAQGASSKGAVVRSSPLATNHIPEPRQRNASVASVSSLGSAMEQSGELPRQRASLRRRFVEFWKVRHTTGESSRDFLARERTFFSWLRLSTLLAIVAGALSLRLRLQPTSSPSQPSQYVGSSARSRRRRRIARSRLEPRPPIASPLTATLLSSIPLPLTLRTVGNRIYDSPVLANGLGALFLVLALAALTAGWIDYLTIERALEEADRKVENETLGQEGTVEVCHDLKAAGGAHSSRAVFILEIVISISVGATAVLLLISDGASDDSSTVFPGPSRRAWYGAERGLAIYV